MGLVFFFVIHSASLCVLVSGSGNVNWYNYYGEQYRVFFKKIKIGLTYDSGITFQGIYPKKTNSKQCIHSNSDGKDTKEKKMLTIQDSKGIRNNENLLRIEKN